MSFCYKSSGFQFNLMGVERLLDISLSFGLLADISLKNTKIFKKYVI
jgi:hypothetical protein